MTRRTTLTAGITALATLPALLVGPVAGAKDNRVDGVRAEIKRGALVVQGDDRANRVALRLQAGNPTVVQVDVGDDGSPQFSFARADIAAIKVRTGDGDDTVRVDDANGSFTNTIAATVAGGDGDDSLTGGLGNETYRGGEGDDFVDGNGGADTGYLGDGEDTFRWDPGDGSDVIDGQDGTDTMLFNGAAGGETVTLSPRAGRLDFFRVQGNVRMDTNDVEVVDFNALGGADTVTVNDLSGTDVRQTNVDRAIAPGGNVGDALVDNITVNGTDGDDNIAVTGAGTGVDVTGLSNTVSITNADPTDRLSVNTLAGTDDVLTNGIVGVIQVLVDGPAV